MGGITALHRKRFAPLLRGLAGGCFLVLFAGAASAQTPSGCTLRAEGGGRQTLQCQDGLTIVAEAGAEFAVDDRDSDGAPDGIRLKAKALLLEAPRKGDAKSFEVSTPQAIAAVRGTRWIVDVASGKTSVFVQRGAVAVHRPGTGDEVLLRPGDGVDVEVGGGPLRTKRWPQARVSALLARLGQ